MQKSKYKLQRSYGWAINYNGFIESSIRLAWFGSCRELLVMLGGKGPNIYLAWWLRNKNKRKHLRRLIEGGIKVYPLESNGVRLS